MLCSTELTSQETSATKKCQAQGASGDTIAPGPRDEGIGIEAIDPGSGCLVIMHCADIVCCVSLSPASNTFGKCNVYPAQLFVRLAKSSLHTSNIKPWLFHFQT